MYILNKMELTSIIISLIILITVASTFCQHHEVFPQKCTSNEVSANYLNTALDMLEKARDYFPTACQINQPQDCADVLKLGNKTSGIYRIWPQNRVMECRSVAVYCDMETDGGGWTVIQRRGNFQRPVDYFYKNWESYKKGFGDLDKDFWLGNDNIFAISNQKKYSIRFDLQDVAGSTAYALYDFFWIDDEYHKYMLHIKDYRGDAGDSMSYHDENNFSTKDQKNNGIKDANCAVNHKGAWWYKNCLGSNLNGLYLRGKHESNANGVNWIGWRTAYESLERTEMKIRPKDFLSNHQSMHTIQH